MQNIPYSEMKKDQRAYEILLLRDQKGLSFNALAKMYHITISRVRDIYNRYKLIQIRLYLNHIAFVLGHRTVFSMQSVYYAYLEYFSNRACACAYLEKEYKDILTAYRKGEPGMPEAFIQSLPPFKQKLSQKEVERVIEMREKENASFKQIGKALRITREKAKSTYDGYYHKQVLQMIAALEEGAESEEEKAKIHRYYFDKYYSSKRRYDMLLANGACINRENKDK